MPVNLNCFPIIICWNSIIEWNRFYQNVSEAEYYINMADVATTDRMRCVCYSLFFVLVVACSASPRSLRWVGDVWIPPNGKLYTIDEIQKTFERRRVLIVGDSLARRLTATLALIINDEDNNDLLVSDVDSDTRLGRGGHKHYEWSVPSALSRLHYQWTPHARDVASYVTKTDLTAFSDVIVAIGVHDAERPSTVPFEDDIKAAMNALGSCGASVVWRTAPYMDNPNKPEQTTVINRRLDKFNLIVQTADVPNVRIIDVASTLAKKSVGKERLKGDSVEHFGNIARMVEIQTLTHILKTFERGRRPFTRLGI